MDNVPLTSFDPVTIGSLLERPTVAWRDLMTYLVEESGGRARWQRYMFHAPREDETADSFAFPEAWSHGRSGDDEDGGAAADGAVGDGSRRGVGLAVPADRGRQGSLDSDGFVFVLGGGMEVGDGILPATPRTASIAAVEAATAARESNTSGSSGGAGGDGGGDGGSDNMDLYDHLLVFNPDFDDLCLYVRVAVAPGALPTVLYLQNNVETIEGSSANVRRQVETWKRDHVTWFVNTVFKWMWWQMTHTAVAAPGTSGGAVGGGGGGR